MLRRNRKQSCVREVSAERIVEKVGFETRHESNSEGVMDVKSRELTDEDKITDVGRSEIIAR